MARALKIAVMLGVLSGGLNPQSACADDAARINRLELEIQQLRTRIDELHRRVLRLEAELDRSQSKPLVGPTAGSSESRIAAGKTEPLPWHAPEAWARITHGMSESQVTEILGPPTAVESINAYKSLFYRGSAAGSGTLSGLVNLRDGRVVAVNAPDF